MDEQEVERVAREYCRLTKQNPDETVMHGADPDERGFVVAVACHSPRWRLIAKRVRDEAAMRDALLVLNYTTAEREG